MRSVTKCDFHRSHVGRGGLAYYRELGELDAQGVPQCAQYAHELRTALLAMGAEVPLADFPNDVALEIGCGLGMYGPWLMAKGYQYEALEPDAEAASWVESALCAHVYQGPFEAFDLGCDCYRVILAAHVLEHVQDAPTFLTKCLSLLRSGGQLILIVPDDRDPVNPDHLWFFSESGLRQMLKDVGFVDIKSWVKRDGTAREDFIYAVGVKP